MKDQPADNVNDSIIFQLSTTELLDLYHKRKDRADLPWAQIMMRAVRFERTQQENDKIVRLLRECMPHIEHTDETDLRSRVTDALAEYQEQS